MLSPYEALFLPISPYEEIETGRKSQLTKNYTS